MRILLVSDYYPPFIGGVQRQIQLLGRELAARGHEVEVVTVWSPGTARRERDGDVVVHRVGQLRSALGLSAADGKHYASPFPDPIAVVGIRRVVRRFRPDVVHTYGWLSYSAAVALAGIRVPVVLSARDYAYGCAKRTLLRNGAVCPGPSPARCVACASRHYGPVKGTIAAVGVRVSRPALLRRVSRFHSISRYVRDVVRRDVVRGRARALPHEILPSFGESPGTVRPAADDPALAAALAKLPAESYILFVGALRRVKGVEVLLAAYRMLDDPPPLVLAGTVETDTPQEFPDGVVVVEDLPHAGVMLAWERALFGVAPSLWPEPLGSVVYEGMSAGRAVIGTHPGGHVDMIVDGETGRLVPAGDTEALAGAMRELIADAPARERLGRAARERARRFTAQEVVPQWERVYREVIGRQVHGAEPAPAAPRSRSR